MNNSTKQKFAAFDIDGTIFRWQLYHELFDALAASGHINDTDHQTVNKAREAWSRREQSFSDYEHLLVNVMERKVIGLPERVVKDHARDILLAKGHRLYAYTKNLMDTLRTKGYFIIAISGSYQQLVEAFAELHRIDLAIGTDYELDHGNFASKSRTVFGHKGPLLQAAVTEHDLSWDDSFAIGDSGSDADMLRLVTHPIAFNPDNTLYSLATQQGWDIVIERKSVAYTLSGQEGKQYYLTDTTLF